MIILPVVLGVVAVRPVVTGAGGAGGVPYVASQSSDYFGNAIGTYANLTDSDGTTGAATFQGGSGPGYIKASYASAVLVSTVKVGGGSLTNYGPIAASLNNAKLQYSTDDATWIDVLNITGVADSGSNQFKTFSLPMPTTARYWRLYSLGISDFNVGTSELVFT